MEYILWVNYGCEGWAKNECKNINDLKIELLNTQGREFLITQKVNISIEF